MSAIVGSAHTLARWVIGVLLILSGAIEFYRPVLCLADARCLRGMLNFVSLFTFVVTIVLLKGIPVGLGIASLRRRARNLTAGYCLLGIVVELLTILFGSFLGLRHEHYLDEVTLHVWGFRGLGHTIYLSLYMAGAVFLILPQPFVTVRNPPATPDGDNWRKWLLASLQGEGVHRVRDRFQRGFIVQLLVAAGVTGFMATAVLINLPFILGFAPRSLMLLSVLAWVAIAIAVWRSIERRTGTTLGSLERRATLRIRTRNAEDELQRAGSRRPILYLRSFALDAHILHEAEVMGELRKLGPVIAIGRPGEDVPPLGAARFYVDDAHWKAKVMDVLKVAQLVVWATGVTEGLRWELSYLRETVPPEKLVLWAHPPLLGLSGAAAEAEWSRFLAALGGLFHVPLPAQLGGVRFFSFDKDWRWTGVCGPSQTESMLTVLVEKGLRHRRSYAAAWARRLTWRLLYYLIGAIVLVAIFLKIFYR